MSTRAQSTATADRDPALTEDDVARFLSDHPDFFEQHAELLSHLTLPHQTGGSAVSLVERQVSVLRDRNAALDRKLRDLMSVAHSNDSLSQKLHALTLRVLDAPSSAAVIGSLEEGLRVEFGADQSTLVLFNDNHRYAGLDDLTYARQVPVGHTDLKPFKTFLEAARPRCGKVRDAMRAFLFGPDNLHIQSTALVPLGASGKVGILAIGSKDPVRFHPGMGTDFLARLGEIVGVSLKRHAVSSAT
jgi:uncharacterized protein YigA (DUF484 family)